MLLIASPVFPAFALQFRQVISDCNLSNCLGASRLESSRPLAFPSSESSAPVKLNSTNSTALPWIHARGLWSPSQKDPPWWALPYQGSLETDGKPQGSNKKSWKGHTTLSLSGSYIPSSISFQHENLNKTICSKELLKMHCQNLSLTEIWLNSFYSWRKKIQTECITLHTWIISHHFLFQENIFTTLVIVQMISYVSLKQIIYEHQVTQKREV